MILYDLLANSKVKANIYTFEEEREIILKAAKNAGLEDSEITVV
jgi:hypothetical protein